MLRFYVYAYLRTDNTPYYIGKGTGSRAWKHCKSDSIHPPIDTTRIIIVENNLTNFGALALERRMIRWYGRIDNNTGILHNKTDGGEGTAGYKQTAEHIAKRCKLGRSKIARVIKSFVCCVCNSEFTRTYTAGDKRCDIVLTHCSMRCININKAKWGKNLKKSCRINKNVT